MNTRRSFIKKSSLAGAGIAIAPNLSFGITHGNNKKDKLRMAFIGVGLRGTNHLNNALRRKDVEVVAICDIDPNRIAIALDKIQKANAKKPAVFVEECKYHSQHHKKITDIGNGCTP